MAKCIIWTREAMDEFLTKSGNLLSRRQKDILQMHLEEYTISQMAARLNVSEPTVHKDIKKIRDTYKLIQKKSDHMYPIFKNQKEIKEYLEKI